MSRRAPLWRWLTVVSLTGAALVRIPIAGADDVGIAVTDAGFQPSKRDVHTGDTVWFVRAHNQKLPHSVASDNNVFPEQDLSQEGAIVRMTFHDPGTYAYYCSHHGGPGGQGMSGVITVTDAGPRPSSTTTTGPPPSTTTTAPPATTTTSPPTTTTRPPTTTTRPPTTTTRPPTTATTVPPTTATTAPTINGRPLGAGAAPTTTGPPPPPSTSAPRKPAESSTTSTLAKSQAAALGKDASTTTTTGAAPAPPPLDPAILAEVTTTTTIPAAAPSVVVEPLDPRTLAALGLKDDQPIDNGSGLLAMVGAVLGVIGLVAAAWAWYHRPSRYLPA
jgi:plastocyanin